MINNAATNAIMSVGMKCLIEKLGVIDAEIFISALKDSVFDYTEWRQDNLWKGLSAGEILQLAAQREKEGKRQMQRE